MRKMLNKTGTAKKALFALVICLVVVSAFLPQEGIKAQSGTQLVISPSTSDIPVGGSTTVNVNVVAGSGVNGFDITLTYDPAVVSLESWDFGGYLSNLLQVIPPNLSSGQIKLVYVQNHTADAVGDGTLLTFTFEGLTTGCSAVTISSATLANSSGDTYSPLTQNGTINIIDTSTDTPTVTPEATNTPTSTHTATPTFTRTPTATYTRTPTRTPTRTATHAFVPSSTFTPTRTLSMTRTPGIVPTGQAALTATPAGTTTPVPTGTSAALLTLTVWPTATGDAEIAKNITETPASTVATPTESGSSLVDSLTDLISADKLEIINQLMCGVSLLLLILLLVLILMIVSRRRNKNKNKSS